MIANNGGLPVTGNEWLARYILRKSEIRTDGTVKPDGFTPYKWVELSVTRHLGLVEGEIWQAGKHVAAERREPLIGRADTQTKTHTQVGLRVIPAPLEKNPNHANSVGWPSDKPSQKEIALLISREAKYTSNPDAP
jgi:hypothetical protein